MPFTLSHAAAVLPAVRGDGSGRGRLVPAALVAGSFSPDMTYYAAGVLPGAMRFGAVTHSFAGVVTVDVPVSWALVGLWLLLREPLVALLPPGRRGRWAALLRCGAPRARVRPASAAWWYVSAVLGASTHVVWDAFTHHDRWGVRLFPVLARSLAGVPLYQYLQYGCSLVGALVIAAWVGRAAGRAAGSEPAGVALLSVRDRWWAAAAIGGGAAAGAVQRALRWWEYRGATAGLRQWVPTLCFGLGAGLVAGLLLYAVAVRVWRPARTPGGSGGTGARRAGAATR
ncbi:DUF4184 family protein [Streptomyces sp. NPDC001348]